VRSDIIPQIKLWSPPEKTDRIPLNIPAMIEKLKEGEGL